MKLTVITVCLNASKTIERTIDSVISQVTPNSDLSLEYIVVDGGSSDNTLELLEKYPQIKLISEPDDGLYDAMNKGIRMAKGDVIAVLNADDWYEKGVIEKVLNTFKSDPNLSVVHGDVRRWLVNGQTSIGVKKTNLSTWHKYIGMPFYHPTFFVKKKVYEKFGMFNIKYKIAADYDFFLRTVNLVNYFYLPEVITNFSYGGVSSNNWAFKERVNVRSENGQPLVFAVIVVFFMQMKKTVRLLIHRFK